MYHVRRFEPNGGTVAWEGSGSTFMREKSSRNGRCRDHVSIHTTPDARGHERRGRGRGRDGTSHAAHLKDTQDSRRRSHAGETGAQNGKRKPRGRAHRATRHARAYAQLARPPIAASALSALSSIRISSRHPGSARACARSRIARPTSSRSALHLARRRRTRRRGRAGWHQPSRHHKRKGIGRDGPRKNCSMLFPATAAPHGRCAGHAHVAMK